MRGSAADASALLRVAQMEEADRLTVQAGTPAIELMQNAGAAVAREIARRWSPRPTVVLCGPGNNGGDGFVIARVLAAAGWSVRLALAGSMEQLRGDARHHALLWQRPIEPLEVGVLEKAALVVDAVFGSGLRRPLSGEIPRILKAAAERRVPIVAVDVPSGLLGDTGESLGAVPATVTVTFTRKKPGHVLLPGRELCGETVVADIGTTAALLERIPLETWENDPALWRGDLPQLGASGNKYSRGHALLWGGYPTTGAARMAARGAARAGAGLTTIAVPVEALPIYAAALTSIMVRAAPTPADLGKLLADKRFNALLIGPGAGVDAETRARALAMLATRRAVLLDADAISAFAQDREALFAAVAGPCVLTPHDGEFARLFDASGDKLSRARAAARTSGAVLVLKGADTVVAAPDGRAVINSNAPSTLATAGSGDVLGGMILGLLAQGMGAFAAAAAGVWLHGAAAGDFGPGLLAEDLPDLLPGVLRRLLA
jgi:ADP-dependent NAD(P)H-hydrate dehydratase / NAD(P)H-hydrate epimerase